jgi:hypothetical protein
MHVACQPPQGMTSYRHTGRLEAHSNHSTYWVAPGSPMPARARSCKGICTTKPRAATQIQHGIQCKVGACSMTTTANRAPAPTAAYASQAPPLYTYACLHGIANEPQCMHGSMWTCLASPTVNAGTLWTTAGLLPGMAGQHQVQRLVQAHYKQARLQTAQQPAGVRMTTQFISA